jgi:hypothetical protein
MQLSQEESETLPSALDLAYLARQTFGDAGLEAELLRAFQLRRLAFCGGCADRRRRRPMKC